MQRLWSADELGERWSLLPDDPALLARQVDAAKLGFAVQLAFWRQHGRFPDEEADVGCPGGGGSPRRPDRRGRRPLRPTPFKVFEQAPGAVF